MDVQPSFMKKIIQFLRTKYPMNYKKMQGTYSFFQKQSNFHDIHRILFMKIQSIYILLSQKTMSLEFKFYQVHKRKKNQINHIKKSTAFFPYKYLINSFSKVSTTYFHPFDAKYNISYGFSFYISCYEEVLQQTVQMRIPIKSNIFTVI